MIWLSDRVRNNVETITVLLYLRSNLTVMKLILMNLVLVKMEFLTTTSHSETNFMSYSRQILENNTLEHIVFKTYLQGTQPTSVLTVIFLCYKYKGTSQTYMGLEKTGNYRGFWPAFAQLRRHIRKHNYKVYK